MAKEVREVESGVKLRAGDINIFVDTVITMTELVQKGQKREESAKGDKNNNNDNQQTNNNIPANSERKGSPIFRI